MADDPLLTHAREFTDVETDGLTLWNSLQDAGQEDLALKLLDATLMLEHYTSLLPHKVSDRSDAQIRQQAQLREVLNSLQAEGKAALAASAGT